MNAKRKGPSRLMASMEDRVNDLGGTFISGTSGLNHTFELPIEKIIPDLEQARKKFDENSINDLAQSLIEHGQLMPILVRPCPTQRGQWILVAGERRWRAAKKAGIKTLLAIERTSSTTIASLIENIQREDLNFLEEAYAIKSLISYNEWSQREAAQKLGKSVSYINGMLGILKLPDSFLNCVLKSEHELPRNLLIELARVTNVSQQKAFFSLALQGDLTIQKIRAATKIKEPKSSNTNKQTNTGLSSFTKSILKWEKISYEKLSENEKKIIKKVAQSILENLSD